MVISDYKIVEVSNTTATKTSVLEHEIKRLIKNDWHPLGGIAADSNGTLYQVMIKYEAFDYKSPDD